MRILLVAATFFEIRPFLSKLVHIHEESNRINHYQFNKSSVDVLITGIGMIQTAYYLGKQLAVDKYDLAINAGIGGAYSKDLKIGEVLQVTEECITELGIEEGENFLTMFELGLMDPDTPPFQHGLLINNNPVITPAISKLKRVRGATANTVHGNLESINKVRNKFHPQEESMEGAACFYAFLSEKLPFAEIRAISNFVEVRDKTRWNLDLAVENLNKELEDVFLELCV